jgi:hypothetical protein
MKSQLKHFCLFVVTALVVVSWSDPSESASAPYYYLHVASFRSEKSATDSVKYLKRNNVNTVIRKEKILNKGDWYRVYVGPYSTRSQAEQVARDLKNKKVITYASVQKKGALLVPSTTPKTGSTAQKPKQATTSPTVKSAPPKPASQKTTPVKPQSAPPAAKKSATDAQPTQPEKNVTRTEKKKSASITKQLKGRNIFGRRAAIGYKHTYMDIDTIVTSRQKIESNGTTTVTDVSLAGAEKERFPTSMHLDTLVFRYGFTDFLEVFGEAGISYDDSISDAGFAWGGGLRLNLFQTSAANNTPAFYGALIGEYFQGEFENDYTSAQGSNFRRETEWQEATGRAEIGLNHPRFNLYAGGTYLYYQEDTDRKQLNNLPASVSALTFSDKLESKNDFGVYGGVSFFITPKFLINIEGRGVDMTAISGLLEYRF